MDSFHGGVVRIQTGARFHVTSKQWKQRPKIVIDARMVKGAPHGFARYIGRMAQGLSEMPSLSYEPLFLVNREYQAERFSAFPVHVASSEFLSPRELIEIPGILREFRAALFHSPTFSSFFCLGGLPPLSLPCPWIQTVHDLNHLHFGGLKERLYYRYLLRPFARRASALVTVSAFSRDEMVPWLGLDLSKIEIVPNAIVPASSVTPAESDRILRDYGVKSGSYFLCLSNTKPHKNLTMLVAAYAEYRAQAGSKNSWPLLLSVRGFDQQDGIIQAGPVPDKEGEALLASAGAVVFPSLYEGFGIPPVEAAVQGIPVVVSDIPPHREGLQDLCSNEAFWVAPKDRAAWAAALDRVARRELAPPSKESREKILKRYSVANLGRGMDRLYRRVLGLSA